MPDKKKKTEHVSVSKSTKGSSEPSKRSVAIIAAIVGALLVVVGLVYYFAVRQNPTNIVMDSVVNTLEAKSIKSSGSAQFAISQLGASVGVQFSADKADQNGLIDAKVTYQSNSVKKPVEVGAKAILAKDGTLYLKLDDAKVATSLIFAEMNSLSSRVQSQGSKVRPLTSSKLIVEMSGILSGKWIKFPVGANSMLENNNVACIQSALAKVNANSGERNKIIQAYKDNDFLVIDNKTLPKEGSSDGYRLSIDNDKFTAFKTEAAKTEPAKLLQGCSADNNQTMTDSDDIIPGALDVWIDRNSHKITHIKTTDDDADVKLDVKLDVGAKTTVDVPSDAKTFEQIFNEPAQQAKKK